MPILFCLLVSIAHAQFFTGLRSSPYGGITNVNWNPAIADSRFIADVNLFSAGVNVGNNYVGVDRNTFLKKGYVQSGVNFQDTYMKER